MPRLNTIKIRRGTAAAWTAANPVLEAGEPGLETDTNQVKYGDGVTAWNSLDYSSSASSGGTGLTYVPFQAIPNVGEATFTQLQWAGTLAGGIRRFQGTAALNDEIGYVVNLAAGTYDMIVYVDKDTTRGIVTPYLDGVSIGSAQDLYNGSLTPFQWTVTGIEVEEGGEHTLSFKVTSKNASSTGYFFVAAAAFLTKKA